jgi:uncharacterized protein (DUF1778 family)
MSEAASTGARKYERLEARISAETKALCLQAASIQGQSLTDFIVGSAVESALRVVRQYQVIELSRRDQLAFVKSLLSPPRPNQRLQQAAQRYEQVLGNR